MSKKRAIFRVYFNAHADFPLITSIDSGDDTKEYNVKDITIFTQSVITSHYRPERQPKFWLEVEGDLEIFAGRAVIT